MNSIFFTSTSGDRMQRETESPRGRLLLASCRDGNTMAATVVERYEQELEKIGYAESVPFLCDIDFQFSDNEVCARLNDDVNGCDVFLFQSLFNPGSERCLNCSLLAFLAAVRSFRDWGANTITGILPYLTYLRQDKPTKYTREPTTAKLLADLLVTAGLSRIVVWHPHTSQIHGFFSSTPVDALDATDFWADEFQEFSSREDVIVVAPDAGALKLVTGVGKKLGLPYAVASKHRPRQEEAAITDILGDFGDRKKALILDDMISSGGTVAALIQKLVREKGIREVYLGVSHNLCIARAYELVIELHKKAGLKRVVVTDSVPQTQKFRELSFLKVRSLANVFCKVINRIHYNQPVADYFVDQVQTT